jgi:Spy/CpxP family protein refolding chaperone
MNRFLPALAAACFSLAAATAMAQSPSGDAGKPYGGPRHGLRNCSQAADPAKCEAERKERVERVKQAREACKDKPDRRGCMAEHYCAKEQDPAKCQAQAKERAARLSRKLDERQAAHEACTGKRGEELQKCLYAQRGTAGRGGPAAK